MSSLRSAWHTQGELDQPEQPGNTLSQTKILKRNGVTHTEKKLGIMVRSGWPDPEAMPLPQIPKC